MLRATITDDDVVLVCQLVAAAQYVVRGSVQRACAECGRQVWKAPGAPWAKTAGGDLVRVAIAPDVTIVLLCHTCARMHYELRHQPTGQEQ